MKNQQAMGNNKKGAILTMIGVAIMILLTATKVVPSSNIASYSVFVGIAFFFIVEAVSKTPNAESGLRFNTIVEDIKKPGVIAWALVPCFNGIVTIVVGNLIFSGEFVDHVLGRTSSILSFNKTLLLIISKERTEGGLNKRTIFMSSYLTHFWFFRIEQSRVRYGDSMSPASIG